MFQRIFRNMTFALLVLIVLADCAGQKETNLADSTWRLISLHSEPLIEDTEIMLVFHKDYLGGQMTCNQYGNGPDSGPYTATADGSFQVPQLAVTVQLCEMPEGLMEQEKAYTTALLGAAHYRISEKDLEIGSSEETVMLVFERVEE